MKLVLHAPVAAPSLVGRYLHAQAGLNCLGVAAVIRTGVRAEHLDLRGCAAVLSHAVVPEAVRAVLPGRVCGGQAWTRAETLTLLADLGCPVMEWTLVKDQAAALALFDTWKVERLIVKRSGTSGGAGFDVLTRQQPRYATWDYARDIVCREVNVADGNVFKAEMFAGRLVCGWVLKKPPLATRLSAHDDCVDGVRSLAVYRADTERPAERHRGRWTFAPAEAAALEALSAKLTAAGFGYVCVDLMRRPDGTLVAIELNCARVATWWSDQFPETRERFTRAVVEWVKGF